MLVSRPGNLQAHLLPCYLLEVSPKDSIMLLNTLINWKWHILFVFIHWYVIYGVCVVSTELWGESRVFREREQRGWHPASIAASVMIKSWAVRDRGSPHTPHLSNRTLISYLQPDLKWTSTATAITAEYACSRGNMFDLLHLYCWFLWHPAGCCWIVMVVLSKRPSWTN